MDTKSIKERTHRTCQEKISNVEAQSKVESREVEDAGKSMDELLRETNEIAKEMSEAQKGED